MDPFIHQVAAEAHAAGYCHDCAICGKPFTAARQPKACGAYGEENQYPGQAVIYLLCRRCARLSRKEKIERLFCVLTGSGKRFDTWKRELSVRLVSRGFEISRACEKILSGMNPASR